MRSSWLYLAMRSVRLAEPVLIWPAPVPTARSAMKVSSVSPERWLMMEVKPKRRPSSMASSVSEIVPDLIHLDQDRVAALLFDATLEPLRVGDEQVVADKLDVSADLLRQVLPAFPVVFGQPVFERNDGVFTGPVDPIVGHLLACERALVGLLEGVLACALVEELGAGAGGRAR